MNSAFQPVGEVHLRSSSRMRDDFARDDFTRSEGLERYDRFRDTVRLIGPFCAQHQKTGGRVLRDNNQTFELFASLERLTKFVDTGFTVVGESAQRKKCGELRGEDGDDDLLGVDLRDHSRDDIANIELLGSNGCGQSLSDRGSDLVLVGSNFGDSNVHWFANVEDLLQVESKLSANNQL